MEAGKRNKWLSHVKKTMKAHKGKSFKAVLKMAKKTYKGGADVAPYSDFGNSADIARVGNSGSPAQDAAPVGGRRRGSRKTRRGSRKH
jgi:hypothetical protein